MVRIPADFGPKARVANRGWQSGNLNSSNDILGIVSRSGPYKPHNSVDVIDAHSKIVDGYDKRFCTASGRQALIAASKSLEVVELVFAFVT